MSRRSYEKKKKNLLISIIVAVVLIAALLVSLLFADKINQKLGWVPQKLDLPTADKTVGTYKEDGDTAQAGNDLNVHFVDVGQGDACIIEFPDGKNMLIDAGDNINAYKQKLIDYIKDHIHGEDGKAVTYFDYVILTHSDSDHCGGMADVLSKYPAKKFYRPNVYTEYKNPKSDFTSDPAMQEIKDSVPENRLKYVVKDTQAYYNAIRAGYNPEKINGINSEGFVFDPTNLDLDITPDLEKTDPNYYTFTFYGPQEKSYTDWNDYSPIMILDYHGRRFMLSGDSEAAGEAGFVTKAKTKEGKYAIFDDGFTVDVLKLGHHGSDTSSSVDFLNVMTTEASCKDVVAVISCGVNNKYDHPKPATLEKLSTLGFSESNIARTDTMGNLFMRVSCKTAANGAQAYTLYVTTEKGGTILDGELGNNPGTDPGNNPGTDPGSDPGTDPGNDPGNGQGGEQGSEPKEPPITWQKVVYVSIAVILVVLIIYPTADFLRVKNKKTGKNAKTDNAKKKPNNTKK